MNQRKDCALYPLESLLEDTLHDFFLHATGPTITHDVGCAPSIHKTQGDVKFVTVYPRSTYTKDIGVF